MMDHQTYNGIGIGIGIGEKRKRSTCDLLDTPHLRTNLRNETVRKQHCACPFSPLLEMESCPLLSLPSEILFTIITWLNLNFDSYCILFNVCHQFRNVLSDDTFTLFFKTRLICTSLGRVPPSLSIRPCNSKMLVDNADTSCHRNGLTSTSRPCVDDCSRAMPQTTSSGPTTKHLWGIKYSSPYILDQCFCEENSIGYKLSWGDTTVAANNTLNTRLCDHFGEPKHTLHRDDDNKSPCNTGTDESRSSSSPSPSPSLPSLPPIPPLPCHVNLICTGCLCSQVSHKSTFFQSRDCSCSTPHPLTVSVNDSLPILVHYADDVPIERCGSFVTSPHKSLSVKRNVIVSRNQIEYISTIPVNFPPTTDDKTTTNTLSPAYLIVVHIGQPSSQVRQLKVKSPLTQFWTLNVLTGVLQPLIESILHSLSTSIDKIVVPDEQLPNATSWPVLDSAIHTSNVTTTPSTHYNDQKHVMCRPQKRRRLLFWIICRVMPHTDGMVISDNPIRVSSVASASSHQKPLNNVHRCMFSVVLKLVTRSSSCDIPRPHISSQQQSNQSNLHIYPHAVAEASHPFQYTFPLSFCLRKHVYDPANRLGDVLCAHTDNNGSLVFLCRDHSQSQYNMIHSDYAIRACFVTFTNVRHKTSHLLTLHDTVLSELNFEPLIDVFKPSLIHHMYDLMFIVSDEMLHVYSISSQRHLFSFSHVPLPSNAKHYLLHCELTAPLQLLIDTSVACNKGGLGVSECCNTIDIYLASKMTTPLSNRRRIQQTFYTTIAISAK